MHISDQIVLLPNMKYKSWIDSKIHACQNCNTSQREYCSLTYQKIAPFNFYIVLLLLISHDNKNTVGQEPTLKLFRLMGSTDNS